MILNGRTVGDPMGNFPHLNFNNGPSTIDYALCNEKCYKLVSNFLVLPMNDLSDHSKIVTVFEQKQQSTNHDTYDDYDWKPRGKLYTWNKKKRNVFFNTLKTREKEIEEINHRIDFFFFKQLKITNVNKAHYNRTEMTHI